MGARGLLCRGVMVTSLRPLPLSPLVRGCRPGKIVQMTEAEVRGLEQRLQAGEHELWSARRLGEQRVVEVPAPSVRINAN